MSFFPNALENLIDQFAALPGVGRKSAQRLAFHVLSLPEEEALKFAAAIVDAKKNIHCCSICQNLTDQGRAPSAPLRSATRAPSASWRSRAMCSRSSAAANITASIMFCTACCRR